MGIRKNKKNNQTESKLTLPCFFKGKDKLENILFYNIEDLDISVKHRDGKKGNLMLSQIQKIKEDDAINEDLVDYIVFEITEGKEIDKELLQKVAFEYDKTIGEQDRELEVCKYLGQFDGDGITFSETVKQYVVENIVQMIKQRSQDKLNQQKTTMEKRRTEEYRKSLNCNQYIEEQAKINRDRINSPYLKRLIPNKNNHHIEKEGKIENYDGVNTDTGELLRIRKVQCRGKDLSGTYMYTAKIISVPDHDCTDDLENGLGINIAFEVPSKFLEIVQKGTEEEIRKVLEFLSKNYQRIREGANCKELYYLGGIDKDGNIYTAEESKSKAIKCEVERLRKTEYTSLNKEERTL